jgi:hypothetical protein
MSDGTLEAAALETIALTLEETNEQVRKLGVTLDVYANALPDARDLFAAVALHALMGRMYGAASDADLARRAWRVARAMLEQADAERSVAGSIDQSELAVSSPVCDANQEAVTRMREGAGHER